MIIGYARTSTLKQCAGIEKQIKELQALGCDKIFKEQVSSVDERAQLKAAIDYLREGDTLIATKLDRIARSVSHMCDIVQEIKAKGAYVRVLDMNIDTSSATGELILNVLMSIAQFEREIMLERQKAGIEKAKREGKYKGRKAIIHDIAPKIIAMKEQGCTPTYISHALNVSRATVYRALKSA